MGKWSDPVGIIGPQVQNPSLIFLPHLNRVEGNIRCIFSNLNINLNSASISSSEWCPVMFQAASHTSCGSIFSTCFSSHSCPKALTYTSHITIVAWSFSNAGIQVQGCRAFRQGVMHPSTSGRFGLVTNRLKHFDMREALFFQCYCHENNAGTEYAIWAENCTNFHF